MLNSAIFLPTLSCLREKIQLDVGGIECPLELQATTLSNAPWIPGQKEEINAFHL